jgi:hypothetical protein
VRWLEARPRRPSGFCVRARAPAAARGPCLWRTADHGPRGEFLGFAGSRMSLTRSRRSRRARCARYGNATVAAAAAAATEATCVLDIVVTRRCRAQFCVPRGVWPRGGANRGPNSPSCVVVEPKIPLTFGNLYIHILPCGEAFSFRYFSSLEGLYWHVDEDGAGRGLRALETLLRLLVILAAGAWRSRHLVLLAAWPASRTSAAAPRGRLASLCWRSCARSWPCDHAIPPWIRKKSRVRFPVSFFLKL